MKFSLLRHEFCAGEPADDGVPVSLDHVLSLELRVHCQEGLDVGGGLLQAEDVRIVTLLFKVDWFSMTIYRESYYDWPLSIAVGYNNRPANYDKTVCISMHILIHKLDFRVRCHMYVQR